MDESSNFSYYYLNRTILFLGLRATRVHGYLYKKMTAIDERRLL